MAYGHVLVVFDDERGSVAGVVDQSAQNKTFFPPIRPRPAYS